MADGFTILVRHGANGAEIALLNGRGLLEYYREPLSAGSAVGNLYAGKVERVLKDVGAAFVDIGFAQNGFLPLRESDSFHRAMGDAPLVTGQSALVQVKKDAKGGKGAFLTRDIALPGQYLLLMPLNRFIGLSKRVTDEGDRARGRALGEKLAAGRFGVIVRHAALSARPADVLEEAEELWQKWQKLSRWADTRKPPALLYEEAGALAMLTRDYAARHALSVISDAPLEGAGEVLSPEAMDALWREKRVEAELSAALKRRVPIPGGGSLVIDEREALATVDVNSGERVMASGEGSLALEENLRAVEEIARQLRLRNLSGVILIDFIDMDAPHERDRVENALREALADDRIKTVVHGFTRLGLMEITRRRTRDTLLNTLTMPCPACHETGRVRRE